MFIEDLFIKFFNKTISASYQLIPAEDYDVCHSFYSAIITNKHLTSSQRTYVLALLARYKGLSNKIGFNYTEHLTMPVWKNPLRIINKEKTIWVEEQDAVLWACVKFPYQLKEAFDDEVERTYRGRSVWDNENKLRKLKVYDTNLLVLNEFIEKHRFNIDDSYAELFAEYENIISDAEDIVPYATKLDNEIVLVNCTDTAQMYWDENKTEVYEQDLILLKFMGIPYIIPNATTTAEIIASELTNSFWIDDTHKFVNLCYATQGRIGITLDRSDDVIGWLSNFFLTFDELGYNRDDIKVCIKEGRHLNKELNKWLYDNKSKGTNKSKFLIFLHKPAKWVFKDKIQFSIVGTNVLYPSTNSLTNSWLFSHPCVAYLTDIKPSTVLGQKIVKL